MNGGQSKSELRKSRAGNLEKFSPTLLAHAIAAHADSQTKAMARAKPAHP